MKLLFAIFASLIGSCLALGNDITPTHAQARSPAREWWHGEKPKAPLSTPDANLLPRLEVKGNHFVDPAGRTVLLRGLSVIDPDELDQEGHWNARLFEKLKEMGAQIVRLPVHPAAWRTCTPGRYLDLIDQAVTWAGQNGLYIIIDWHSIGNLRTGLFQDAMYWTTREETAAFWRTISIRYGKHHTVAFFELFNEPTSYQGKLGPAKWADWRETNEELISLIRANGAEAIPLVAGFDWAYDLTPLIEDPVRAERIAYVTHPYPNKRSQPWEPKWEENFAFAAAHYPLIATEIGFNIPDGQTVNDDHYGNRITRFLESHGISWLGWVYDPVWTPKLLKSWDTFELTGSGAFFKDALHRPIATPSVPVERKPGDN